jgi:predicted neuraminidase
MGNTETKKNRGLWLVIIAGVYALAYLQLAALPPSGGFAVGSAYGKKDLNPAPFYTERYVSHATTPSVHSAAALAIPGGLRAFWYGGAEEGADDVAIYTATYDPVSDNWSREQPIATRASTAQGVNRYIRKLGNPAVMRDAAGRIWLFYVSVSVGGWSGSAINAMVSTDDGRTWDRPRRLVSSPFFNISTLVKGRPFLYADGSIGVPAYHEFAGKFGEVLRIDAQGNVIGKTRLSHGRYSLQPVVVPRSASEAVAFMRYSGDGPGQVLMQSTRDGGESWTVPVKIALPNPNAAIDAIATADGGLALVFNNRQGNRDNLSLAVSDDAGTTWRVLHRFEDEPFRLPPAEFSYPWLASEHDGTGFHLLYTWKRSHIKHVKFDVDWLKERK